MYATIALSFSASRFLLPQLHVFILIACGYSCNLREPTYLYLGRCRFLIPEISLSSIISVSIFPARPRTALLAIRVGSPRQFSSLTGVLHMTSECDKAHARKPHGVQVV